MDPRRLINISFGLSISAAKDMPTVRDDPEQETNRLMFRLASSILLEGGSLVLGHRWTADGIMEHLAFQACNNRWIGMRQSAGGEAKPSVSIVNLLAWPDAPPTEDHNAQKMIDDGILQVRQIAPPGIPFSKLEVDSVKRLETDLGRFARVRALTAMRQDMVKLSDARLCLGGDSGKPLRRLPGVIEEALCTWQAGKPLYISSALGGAAKAMADAILHRRMSEDSRSTFYTPSTMVSIFDEASKSYPVPIQDGASTETGWNAFNVFQDIPIEVLGEQSGLTKDEYLQLLTAVDVQRVIALAFKGILALAKARSSAAHPGSA